MGRHRGEDGPHTEPLGLLVARSRMHGDESGKDQVRSSVWAVAGVLTLAALSGLTGWLFGHGTPNEVTVTQPVVWRVTVTPSPTPVPPRVILQRVTLTPSPAPPPASRPREPVRWRTVTATPRPAPTVTRWRTETVTPPPEGDTDGTAQIPGGEPGTEQ